MKQIVDKKVRLSLVGLDGNVFALMGAFSRQACREHWTDEEIRKVLDECQTGDYSHAVQTLMAHCVNGGFGLDDEDGE